MTDQISPILAGVAGEYYVAAELSRRGYIASISLRNTRGMDILATNEAGTRSVTIQVKTTQKQGKVWILSDKAESMSSDTHYYIFVQLGSPTERAEFHVVPSKVVAEYVKEDYREWLRTPGKGGKKHNENSVREYRDLNQEFLERWDLLKL